MNCAQTIFALIDYQHSSNVSGVLYLHRSKTESEESCETSGKTSFFIMISLLQDRAALMRSPSEFTFVVLNFNAKNAGRR